jgi:hypothetical protein
MTMCPAARRPGTIHISKFSKEAFARYSPDVHAISQSVAVIAPDDTIPCTYSSALIS